ncbi:hypothetical protein [Hyphomicrobium sp.]|uniref:hypothetical protein n=1 Tax=Hyphomicrobium sp. TaxID=82 RepID=UPI001D84638D|nr:hypothetical protein [Hyphomicrobium sp.]MBY0559046.1 hypothetical protein [Hyphomicrobium sp.]
MRSATTAVISSADTAVRGADWGPSARFIGLAIASIAPALFWCLVVQLIAYWSGISLSPMAVGALFVTIAAFLFAICAPLMLRSSSAKDHAPRTAAPDLSSRPVSR